MKLDVSSSSNPDYSESSLSDALNSVTNAARDQLASEFSVDPDDDEAQISQRKKMVERRQKTYRVQLPLTAARIEGKSDILTIGMSLSQINKGRAFDDKCLNLDTLELEDPNMIMNDEKYDRFDEQGSSRRIDGEYKGAVVSSVLKGGAAWTAGVRAGDILQATSATMGNQMWPKSTLEGVRSAMLSRKATSSSIAMEFQRIGDAEDNQFELSLSKPIGMQLKETDDGFVVVTGLTENAPTLVRYAVKVGDRVLAVDSSLGGKMWPVSTVEGVVSAVTARLPGQEITFRFERPTENMEDQGDKAVESVVQSSNGMKTATKSKLNNEELLKRCRGIIKKYKNSEGSKSSFVGKYDVPGLIADKVLEALSTAEAKVDAVTLSMIMGAYLSCKQANKAVEVFEDATGFSANGCNKEVTTVPNGNDGKKIVTNREALNIFTVSALLKAHAMVGDLDSVERVLAAVEGRAGVDIAGLPSADWPGTGVDGSLTPDTRCYSIALSAAAKSKGRDGLKVALRIFDDMAEPNQKKSPKQKDLVSYNIILNALTTRHRYQEAVNLFYQMKRLGIKPDKFSYTSLMKAIASDIDVEGDIEEVIYDMKEQGVSPDIVTFNTAIRSLCAQRRIIAAKRMVAMMEDCGVSPDSMTYGYLMKSLIDAGKASAALTLFETACSERKTVALTENPYLYTTAISAAASLRDHERALELLTRMSSIGIQPNLKTMTAAMGACLSAGKTDLAAGIFMKIKNPDGYALTQGLEALCESGETSKALSIISQNQGSRGLLKGKLLMKSFKTIISVSLKRDDFGMAREALTALIRGGNLPSREIYEACFEAMELFPKRRKAFQVAGEADEFATQKFQFLLFLLDSIAGRRLPCEGSLYSAVLTYGFTIGGLPKKISTMLVSAKTDFSNDKKLIDDGDETVIVPFFSNWEELFLKYNAMKKRIATDGLPELIVRVSSRDTRAVLKAEKNLTFKRTQLV
ncbi:unnamed protein product [Cylindrotheca closterium]|uniref:PDZ domain-containing protein n=1 Tax=Cylindrotheca closterium TaxID=2856 RepID=A0AAD2FUA2_9STRA|nr:unnamed protein product [Cylindrotheca closterium]